MTAYYNEIEPYPVEWLGNLIVAGEIAPGTIDTRSIADVKGDDLVDYRQVHLFAGIGGWSLALRLAGWPDDRPVWTGSCPCQPYSAAGKGQGDDDPRNLWPHMARLIRECRPPIVFGEQVEAAVRHGWLDGVFRDLEAEGYACGAVVLGAHSVGAPHIRQRLFWVADAERERAWTGKSGQQGHAGIGRDRSAIDGATGGVADASSSSQRERPDEPRRDSQNGQFVAGAGARGDRGNDGPTGGVGNANDAGPQRRIHGWPDTGREDVDGHIGRDGTAYVHCLDGKTRRVGPGVQPLAYGLPRSVGPGSTRQQRVDLRAAKRNRRGRLTGYGNAIVPQVAAAFIKAYMDATPRRAPAGSDNAANAAGG